MHESNPIADIDREAPKPPGVLATDLDGTFIPLEGCQQNQEDLLKLARLLEQQEVRLVFVTGRHLESVLDAIREHRLPQPEWIICDVGTTIYRRDGDGRYQPLPAYRDHLAEIVRMLPVDQLQQHLETIGGLRRQEAEKQGLFKLSFYSEAAAVESVVRQVEQRLQQLRAPYSVISSIDPFTDDGLVDLLPRQTSKAYALQWWCEHLGLRADQVVFAGDSGNDLAAFLAGYRVIVVGNAARSICHNVLTEHRKRAWRNRIYFARGRATSGVLEGCRWFELLPAVTETAAGPPGVSLGARPLSCHATQFRVWAPHRRSVEVEVQRPGGPQRFPLQDQGDGYFSGVIRGVGPGDLYQYRLDATDLRPDPVTRFQPDGVHGWSEVIDPNGYPWGDGHWRGCEKNGLVIYELHIGTFTPGGTYASATKRLMELKDLGITAVELMPIAQSAGRWNWGYDGVNLYAPRETYGRPEELRAFVDVCHSIGLAVILDVVYNHLGPEGNYLAEFGPYFTNRYETSWGPALNYDGEQSDAVREYIIGNAVHWIDEYHFDGLRVDAIHYMFDQRRPSIVTEMQTALRERENQLGRRVLLIGETNVHDPQMLAPPSAGGHGLDAIWCDDFLHSMFAVVSPGQDLTHRQYRGAEDLALALQRGFVFEGFPHQRVDASPPRERAELESLVMGIQNHDFIGNHPLGRRLHVAASPSVQRSAAALFLLYPSIPILFMGEEFAAPAPFHFFVDYGDPHLRAAVVHGRMNDYPQHDWSTAVLPISGEAFFQSQIGEMEAGDAGMYGWYRALIRIRRQWQDEGWLRSDCLQVTHQPQWHLYALRYTRPDGRIASLLVRLSTPEDEAEATPLTVSTDGPLRLHSADCRFGGSVDLPSAADRPIRLGMNEAIVVEGDCGWQ